MPAARPSWVTSPSSASHRELTLISTGRWPCGARGSGALASLALMSGVALAQTAPDAQTVIVTGSVQQSRVVDAPYAITAIGRDALRNAGPMVNLSEALVQVPGLVVNNRSNYAQDLQISSRGFGARAGFGVRGLRLVADGIPASGPDGQGQVSHFDLAGAQRVEVLRGPFSVIYGNSSGGVIALFYAPTTQREARLDLDVGSHGFKQARVSLALPLQAGLELKASASQMETDGSRPQSAASKTQAQVRMAWRGASDTVVVQLNHLDQPADDPLGLTRAQFDLGPEQTAVEALTFKTRKTTEQTQGGVSWRHRFGDGALRESQVALYGIQRSVAQWLAIPVATQGNARHGGGVIAFDRDVSGLDGRLQWAWPQQGLALLAGVGLARQSDARKGFENFTGTGATQVLGVTGSLRRDEKNKAETRDGYLRADLELSPRLLVSAGLRSGRVKLSTVDAFIQGTNGNDSGELQYSYTNPVLGLRWQAAQGLNLHASVARGFESPTLGDLAYKLDGSGGFNSQLLPQTSQQLEVGAKWRGGSWAMDATVFEVQTRNEIAVASNSGGRASFQNVGRSSRRGAELGVAWRPTGPFSAQLSLSSLQSRYRDDFKTCASVPCTAPTVFVPAGGHIAGAPTGNGWAEFVWTSDHGGSWALEARHLGRVAVNDRNTDFAAASTVAALRWSKQVTLTTGLRMEWLLRVDNLADRVYAGSVIVNEANLRFFEPGAPRSVLLSLRLPYSI